MLMTAVCEKSYDYKSDGQRNEESDGFLSLELRQQQPRKIKVPGSPPDKRNNFIRLEVLKELIEININA